MRDYEKDLYIVKKGMSRNEIEMHDRVKMECLEQFSKYMNNAFSIFDGSDAQHHASDVMGEILEHVEIALINDIYDFAYLVGHRRGLGSFNDNIEDEEQVCEWKYNGGNA
jgi:hypothetical protein